MYDLISLFRVISREKYFCDMFILMVKCDIKIYATNWGTCKTSLKGDFDRMI